MMIKNWSTKAVIINKIMDRRRENEEENCGFVA
jgi:hypothetical protein